MKFLCPYCYTEHEIDEILFRCENQYCRKEPDERLEWYESGMKNDEQEFTRHQNNGSNGDIEDEEMTVMASEGAGHVFSPQGSVMEQIKKKALHAIFAEIPATGAYARTATTAYQNISMTAMVKKI